MPIAPDCQSSGLTPLTNSLLIYQSFVLVMTANPKPNNNITIFDSESTIRNSYSNRAIPDNSLVVQRRMILVLFQQLIALISESLDRRWELAVAFPKENGCTVPHTSSVLPSRYSCNAADAKESSLPAFTSFLICSSQRSLSNRRNHSRNSASSAGGS